MLSVNNTIFYRPKDRAVHADAAHAAGKASVGVDIEGGVTCDAAALHILDSFVVKNSALRLAAEAAITVLRVDQIIMSKQAGGPKPRQPGAPDED